ncbi:MAG: agmatine deiminase family protein [Muribaculaceae bacterium]|nr:agmatine deiminase family protein [Muribaculaceae bacterium]
MRRTIYFAPFLKSMAKYQSAWEQIESILKAECLLYNFVPNANDIWVRDFMPFQRHDGGFVIYRYNPDYLKGKEKYITNCRDAFIESGGGPILSSKLSYKYCHHTNLILDGGNMIKCVDKNGVNCVIMTTKVLYENPFLSHYDILKELEKCLGAEVILIPWDHEEPYGHSDGMVRSIGNGKLLLNCYSDFDPKLGNSIKKALGNRFEISELSYGSKYRENSWCHLNYLDTGNIVLVPSANIASDTPALQQIENLTKKQCIPIKMSPIISEGGALHCISWTLKRPIILKKLTYCHQMFTPRYI